MAVAGAVLRAGVMALGLVLVTVAGAMRESFWICVPVGAAIVAGGWLFRSWADIAADWARAKRNWSWWTTAFTIVVLGLAYFLLAAAFYAVGFAVGDVLGMMI